MIPPDHSAQLDHGEHSPAQYVVIDSESLNDEYVGFLLGGALVLTVVLASLAYFYRNGKRFTSGFSDWGCEACGHDQCPAGVSRHHVYTSALAPSVLSIERLNEKARKYGAIRSAGVMDGYESRKVEVMNFYLQGHHHTRDLRRPSLLYI